MKREYDYSCLRDALEDSGHVILTRNPNTRPSYIVENNILYKHFRVFGYNGKRWLDQKSPLFEDNDYRFYIPVAEKKGSIQVGYLYERGNMSNYLLKNIDSMNIWHPYLKWCDIGNHPYPKEIRHAEHYRERIHNRYSDMLIYPDPDITKAVKFPSLIGIAP
jgi:hypothetical protein